MAFKAVITYNTSIGIIHFQGRILSSEDLVHLLKELEGNVFTATKQWVCNLEKLEYCNSTGLNVLIRLLTKIRNNGGECVVCSLSGSVYDLFKRSKLEAVFQLFGTENEALEFLKNNSQK